MPYKHRESPFSSCSIATDDFLGTFLLQMCLRKMHKFRWMPLFLGSVLGRPDTALVLLITEEEFKGGEAFFISWEWNVLRLYHFPQSQACNAGTLKKFFHLSVADRRALWSLLSVVHRFQSILIFFHKSCACKRIFLFYSTLCALDDDDDDDHSSNSKWFRY